MEVSPVANCLCHYNFSVSVDSLRAGWYVAKVYYLRYGYSPADTCHIGNLQFEIMAFLSNPSPMMADPFQSPCFALPVGIYPQAEKQDNPFRIFPNPASSRLRLEGAPGQMKTILIFDPAGRCVLREETGETVFNVDLSGFTAKGLFALTILTRQQACHFKFVRE